MGALRKLMARARDTSYSDGGSGGPEGCEIGISLWLQTTQHSDLSPAVFVNIYPQGGSNEGPERFLFFFPFPPEGLRLCPKWTSTKCLNMLSRFICL